MNKEKKNRGIKKREEMARKGRGGGEGKEGKD